MKRHGDHAASNGKRPWDTHGGGRSYSNDSVTASGPTGARRSDLSRLVLPTAPYGPPLKRRFASSWDTFPLPYTAKWPSHRFVSTRNEDLRVLEPVCRMGVMRGQHDQRHLACVLLHLPQRLDRFVRIVI